MRTAAQSDTTRVGYVVLALTMSVLLSCTSSPSASQADPDASTSPVPVSPAPISPAPSSTAPISPTVADPPTIEVDRHIRGGSAGDDGDVERLEAAYSAARGLHGQYQRVIFGYMDGPSPETNSIPVGPGCEMSTADFNASLRFLDWFGEEENPYLGIGVTVITFASAEEATAFDAAAANGWETCWVENSKLHELRHFYPYEQQPDLTPDGAVVPGRFTETDQSGDGLVGNYQLVNGNVWGHLEVWTPAAVADPEPDRARLLQAFVDLVDQVAG